MRKARPEGAPFFLIHVAGPRIALGHQGYEPCMQLLHLPAMHTILYIFDPLSISSLGQPLVALRIIEPDASARDIADMNESSQWLLYSFRPAEIVAFAMDISQCIPMRIGQLEAIRGIVPCPMPSLAFSQHAFDEILLVLIGMKFSARLNVPERLFQIMEKQHEQRIREAEIEWSLAAHERIQVSAEIHRLLQMINISAWPCLVLCQRAGSLIESFLMVLI